MVEAGIPVGHDHLGEGHAVGDVPLGAVIVVLDLMDDRALAVVEGQPELPVLPAHHVAVHLERRPVRLGDLQRLDVGAQGLPGDQIRFVLAHHRGRRGDHVGPVDLQQLHGVHVDDQLHPGYRVGVGVSGRGRAHPDVGPAQPPVPPLLRHHRLAVGPDVDAAPGPGRSARARPGRPPPCGSAFIATSQSCHSSTVKFGVTSGTWSKETTSSCAGIGRQRDDRLVGLVVRPVPQHRQRAPDDRIALPPGQHGRLGRFVQGDRGEPPGVDQVPGRPQRGRGATELFGAERVERMSGHGRTPPDAGALGRGPGDRAQDCRCDRS